MIRLIGCIGAVSVCGAGLVGCASPAKPIMDQKFAAMIAESQGQTPHHHATTGRELPQASVGEESSTRPETSTSQYVQDGKQAVNPVALSAGSAAPAPLSTLNGSYEVTFHSTWFGPIHTSMKAQAIRKGDGQLAFKANTRPGIAWSFISGVEGSLGPVVAPFIFPSGMLLVWESTAPTPDKPGEGWIGISMVGSFRAKTIMRSIDGPVEIVFRDNRVISMMSLKKVEPATPQRDQTASTPQTTYAKPDFVALTEAVKANAARSMYDLSVLEGDEFEKYFEEVKEASAKVQDDVEYLFAAGMAWRKYNVLPLPIAYRPMNEDSRRIMAAAGESVQPITFKPDEKGGPPTIEVLGFDDPEKCALTFMQAVDAIPQGQGLILDLRSCTGFDLSALAALSVLIDVPVDAGIFFGSSQREQVLAGNIENVPTVEIQSVDDIRKAHIQLDQHRAIRVRVYPSTRRFTGPLAVLTLSRTRSTAEVLALLLKDRPSTRLFGGRTAGRPRLSFERDMGQGYVIRVPEFDFRAVTTSEINGQRVELDFKGVLPHQRTSKDASVVEAKAWLKEQLTPTPALQ